MRPADEVSAALRLVLQLEAIAYSPAMTPFLYRCPNTGQTVQGFVAEEVPNDAYEAITCRACRQNHFVNPTTGKVLGEDESAASLS